MYVIPYCRKTNVNVARELPPPAAWNLLNDTSVDNAWNTLREELLEVERTTVPMKSREVYDTMNPLWMTMVVKRAIKLKRYYNLMNADNLDVAREQYHHRVRVIAAVKNDSAQSQNRFSLHKNVKGDNKQF